MFALWKMERFCPINFAYKGVFFYQINDTAPTPITEAVVSRDQSDQV